MQEVGSPAPDIVIPPIPAPGDTVVSEITPGQSPDAGMGIEYSRVDHTHGTPEINGYFPGGWS